MTVSSDNRLFPGGRHKPALRGYFHLFGVTIVAPVLLSYLFPRVNTLIEYISFAILASGTVYCWGISSLFHCVSWTVNQEIVVQRLDHTGIFLKIATVYTSITTLVAFKDIDPTHSLYILGALALLWSCCLYGIWHIYNRHSDRMKFWVGSVALASPSFPIIFRHLTPTECWLAVGGLGFYGMGTVVYGKKLFDVVPEVFGYHEVFHICTIVAATCAYFLVYSLCGYDSGVVASTT